MVRRPPFKVTPNSLKTLSIQPTLHIGVVRGGTPAGDVAETVAVTLHNAVAESLGSGTHIGIGYLHDLASLEVKVKTIGRISFRQRGPDLLTVVAACHCDLSIWPGVGHTDQL